MILEKKKLLAHKIYKISNISNDALINNIILEIKENYEDKWKSLNKINTSIELPIRISIDSKNIYLSRQLENSLSSIDLVSSYQIEKFNNKEILYKIIFNSTPNRFLDIMFLNNFKVDTSKEIWRLQ